MTNLIHTAPDVAAAPAISSSSLRSAALQQDLNQKIPELVELECLIGQHPRHLNVRTEIVLECAQHQLPLYSLTLGSSAANAPTILFTGGMHGIERIGSQVLIAWLHTLLERLEWDAHLQHQLTQIQLVVLPILNPVGMYLNQRANGNGVDLNRNAPIDAEGTVPLLGGGHRLGPFLPWYRGRKRGQMEAENLALEQVLQRQIFNRPFAATIDLHSGLGMQDRLWLSLIHI